MVYILKTKENFVFSELSLSRLKGVHPKMVEFVKELLKISPYDFTITEGVRSLETQQKYYSWGRTVLEEEVKGRKYKRVIVTKCDGVIKKSKHQLQKDGYSHAIDLAFVGTKKGTLDYSIFKYAELRRLADPLMKKYNVFWGGDWEKFKDRPHWQLNG